VATGLGLAAALDTTLPSIMGEAAQRRMDRYVTESQETGVVTTDIWPKGPPTF